MAGCRYASSPRPSRSIRLLLLCVAAYGLTLCAASSEFYIPEQMIDDLDLSSIDQGILLVDQRPPPNPKAWTLATEHDALRQRRWQRRGVDEKTDGGDSKEESSSSTSSLHPTSIATTVHKTTTSSSEDPTSKASTPTSQSTQATLSSEATSAPLPTAFDQGFPGTIAASCASFLYGIKKDENFQSCYPFSVLLESSVSFFQASKSILEISRTLDASCAANVNACADYIGSLASNLTKASACATDITNKNPIVLQTQRGLLAYKPLYTAACLRNPTTSAYCFAEAVTNATSPADVYPYYLPLNISYIANSTPTCDTCLANTMAVLEAATSDRSSAIAGTYSAAAKQVNVHCGLDFVNTTLAVAAKSAAARSTAPQLALALLLGALLFVNL